MPSGKEQPDTVVVDVELPAKPCCVPLMSGGWCGLKEGHELPHRSIGEWPETAPIETAFLGARSKPK